MKTMPEGAGALRFHEYALREAWAQAIAEAIAEDAEGALAKNSEAGLVVPGGRTPAPVFEHLARIPLPWSRIHLCPTDERWVRPDHPDSNEASIRANLMGKGAGARFHSLWREQKMPSLALPEIEGDIASMPRPFATVASGMGEDGHFASLFPGLPETLDGLRMENPRSCIAIDQPQAGYPRLSLTLPAMLNCPRVILIITGEAKRKVIERALAKMDASLPISVMLAQRQTPIEVFWAP